MAENGKGKVARGTDKPGDKTNDPANNRPKPPARRGVLVYSGDRYGDVGTTSELSDLTDSPGLARARARTPVAYTDSRGRPRNPKTQDILDAQAAARADRKAAKQAADFNFQYNNPNNPNQWDRQRFALHERAEKAVADRKAAVDAFNKRVQGGDFTGMRRLSRQNWDEMAKYDGKVVTDYERNEDGSYKVVMDENGNYNKVPVEGTSRIYEGSAFDAAKNGDAISALEDWRRNQWRTNFNDGVAFSRYTDNFDESRLPSGLFGEDGKLDVSKIKTQRQFDALMHIMKQDQDEVAKSYAENNGGRRQNVSGPRSARIESAVDAELGRYGLIPEKGAGLQDKIAMRDRARRTNAVEAVKNLIAFQSKNGFSGPARGMAGQQLAARMALRAAGYKQGQIDSIMGASRNADGSVEYTRPADLGPMATPTERRMAEDLRLDTLLDTGAGAPTERRMAEDLRLDTLLDTGAGAPNAGPKAEKFSPGPPTDPSKLNPFNGPAFGSLDERAARATSGGLRLPRAVPRSPGTADAMTPDADAMTPGAADATTPDGADVDVLNPAELAESNEGSLGMRTMVNEHAYVPGSGGGSSVPAAGATAEPEQQDETEKPRKPYGMAIFRQ